MGLFSGIKKTAGGLIGGLTGAGGASAASGAAADQERLLREGLTALDTSYTNQQNLLNPFLGIGTNALNTYAGMLGLNGQPANFSAFEASPDYRFALEQGQQGIDRAASAGGNLFSGNRLKEAARFNQGLATQNFQNYSNRLGQLANLGPQTASMLSGYQGALGQNKANLLGQIGDARAGGRIGEANSYANAGGNLLSMGSKIFSGGIF